MDLRGVLAGLAVLVAATGCSSVVNGHGVAAPRAVHTSTGGFPSTSPPTSSAGRPGAIESPDNDFSVLLPDGWSDGADRLSGLVLTGYFGPTTNGFATNVNVTRESVGGMDVRQYVAAAKQSLSAVHASGISQPTPREVDGEPALEYSFHDTQVGRQLKQRQTVVVHNGDGYVITYTALPESYDASLDDADAIIDSWQWG